MSIFFYLTTGLMFVFYIELLTKAKYPTFKRTHLDLTILIILIWPLLVPGLLKQHITK